VIEALPLGPAHVAGLSSGGTVVLELYRHHPELVATLILVDTYAGWKGSLPEEEVRARVAGALEMLAAPAEAFDPTGASSTCARRSASRGSSSGRSPTPGSS
jgi:pimeloyl-ACP methyl ester carboxylesterase